MTAQEIIDDVVGKLAAEGQEKIRKRRRTIAALADARDLWPGLNVRLKSREGAVFTTDQGLMANANTGFKLKLLVRGHHVANLEFSAGGTAPTLTPRDRVAHFESARSPRGRFTWSKDPKEGTAIRAFIRECDEKLESAQHELQVQLQLVRRLCESKKPSALTNLRPVMPFGFPTELATVVDRLGNAAKTGNMDILARTVQGSRRGGGEFVVMELKQPRLALSQVPKAFRQAIGYAAALTVEANDFGSPPGDDPVHSYRRLFAPPTKASTKSPNYAGKPVKVHAVVVLPESCEARAESELEKLDLGVDPRPMVGGQEMGVGVLLYNAARVGAKQEWELGRSFRWISHAGSWQP